MVQYPSDSVSSASGSVYEIKKAPYKSSDHSSSAHRKLDSNLKDIIKQKDDMIENEPPRRKEVVLYFRTAIPGLYINEINHSLRR